MSTITTADIATTQTNGEYGQRIVTGNPTAGSYFGIDLKEYNQFSGSVIGSFNGELWVEGSIDYGVTFVPIDILVVGVGVTTNSITSACVFKANAAGLTNIRIRAVSLVSGTPSVAFVPVYTTDYIHQGATSVFISGQVVIAVTGTAVALSTTSQILQNGLSIKALKGNNANGGTYGGSNVTNVVDGTGNGMVLYPGEANGVPSGFNVNQVYVNGTAGDAFAFIGD